MKYCKQCGVLYSTDVCPKCGIEEGQQEEPLEADKQTLTKQWMGLMVGIPLFILVIYVFIYLLYTR